MHLSRVPKWTPPRRCQIHRDEPSRRLMESEDLSLLHNWDVTSAAILPEINEDAGQARPVVPVTAAETTPAPTAVVEMEAVSLLDDLRLDGPAGEMGGDGGQDASSSDSDCGICLEPKGKRCDSKIAAPYSCKSQKKHRFHENCVEKWKEAPGSNQKCPVCREPLDATSDTEDNSWTTCGYCCATNDRQIMSMLSISLTSSIGSFVGYVYTDFHGLLNVGTLSGLAFVSSCVIIGCVKCCRVNRL